MDSNNITFPIYNADGTPFHDLVLHKSVVDSVVMSLGDKITGDVYYKDNTLPVTMSEYIEYKRNEDSDVVRYVLVNPPTIIREGMASDNSELRGMTKYSFTFYHPMYQLGNIPFTDVAVSSNEEKYLSQSKTFSWAGRGLDFINKINKNLQGTPWLVIASTDAYTVEKLSLQPDKVVHSKSENNVESNVLSFDKVFISDAIKKAYDTWEVPFVVDSIQRGEYYYTNGQNQRIDYYDEGKRFVVLFGVPSNEIYNKTSHVAQGTLSYNGRYYYMNKAITLHTGEGIEITNFTPSYILKANVASEQEVVTPSLVGELLSDTGKYIATEDMFVVIGSNNTSSVKPYKYLTPFVFMFGQGVGLKNNSRTPKNNKIVTRIIGSGSENNIPYGYPQIPWYGDQTWEYTINNQSGTHEITLPDGRTVLATSYPIYKGILGGRYVNLIKHPFTRNQLMPSVYRETLFNKVSPYKFRAVRQDETNYVSLQTIYDYINQMIGSAQSGSVLRNAYQELKDTIESVVASEELKTVTFGNAQSDGYEGSVTSYSSTFYTLVRGTLEVDGVEYVNYSFEDASVEDIALDSYKNEDFDPTIELVDYYDADDDTYPHPAVQGSESSEIHQFGDIKPEFTQHSIVDIQPYNLEHADDIPFDDETINSLMPFLNQCYTDAKNEKAKACLREVIDLIPYTHGNDDDFYVTETDGSYTCECKVKAVDKYYLVVTFTSPDLNFVKHALQNGVTNPPVDWDDSLKPDSDEYVQSYFKMKLPQLDFDLYACASITEEMKINMRSGACIGSTFDVYVDWDDYKANFYKEEGGKSVFDPIIHTTEGDGHVRDGNKYPDSSQGQVTLIVKKDLDTFGTLMPNTYQQPEQGDEFVILGISLPETYITNAEGRLDDAMEEYMLENNVYYYEYPLKFDEHFLATHKDILAQIRNNTIIRFQYGGEPMALYVKQMTIKYGDSPLPKYDITLADDVEIVLNQIGQTMDDVSRMRVQVSELQKYYSQNIINAINEKLSKVVDDVCQGRITFQQGLDSIGSAIFRNELRSPDFVSGLYTGKGWRIDELGNAEMESLRVRSYLEIVELLVNRMQAQEGDTMFSDNDQIDKVDKIEVGGNVSYILSLKEKWSGYVTSQMYGNILKGIINTLAAKQSGVSDVTDVTDSVYYTSWMRVVDTHNTDGTLGVNQIRVELYNDNETPAGTNFEPCELMTIARWGCMGYNAYYSEKYQAEGLATETAARESIKRRQQVFYLSTSEGRIVKLNSVYKPKLENGNYGTTLGELPEFVKQYSAVAPRLVDGGDYLYAQGIVVGDFIKIDKRGMPMVNYVDKGEWKDNTEYLVNEYNSDTMQYETHDVWHNGAYWRCLIHQPIGGTYYEPSDDSQYWKKLLKSGNDLNIKGNAITIEIGDIVDVWGAYEEPSILSKTEKGDAILGSATHEVSGDHYVLRRTDEYWDEDQEKLLHYVVESVNLSDAYVIKERQGVSTDYNEHMFVATARNDDASDGMYYWQDLGRIKGEKGDQGENAVLYTLEPSIPQFNTNVERTKVQTCVVSAYKTYGSTKEAYTGYFRVVANFESAPSLVYQLQYGNSVEITTNKASNAISYTVTLYDTALITHETNPLAMINIPVAFDGEQGERGKVGRFFYFGGVWEDTESSASFVINDAQAPYFQHTVDGQKRYHVYNPSTNPTGGTITKATMAQTDWNSKPWEVMTDDFKYIITQALFAAYAHLGSWIFNSDYMLSEKDGNGNPRGQQEYNGMGDSQLTSGFIPTIAFDALNGRASFGGDKVRFQPDGSGWLANKNIQWNQNGSGHLAKGNISWDANGNVTFKGNGQFYGTIVTPFRELSSPWVDINNGGCIKITNNVPDLSLPVHKDLDGAEVDIVNMTSQNKDVVAAGGTGIFLLGSYEVTGIVIRSTSLVCRLKAICEDPENDDTVKWMIMNQTDFRRVQNENGTFHAESYDCLNDSIKFNNTVSFGAPVCFPGTMLGGSPVIGGRGEEAHGEMILWFAATRNTIDFGSHYVRLNTGATQHTFTSQTDRAYMFVYNYYDSWLNVQGVWWQL